MLPFCVHVPIGRLTRGLFLPLNKLGAPTTTLPLKSSVLLRKSTGSTSAGTPEAKIRIDGHGLGTF